MLIEKLSEGGEFRGRERIDRRLRRRRTVLKLNFKIIGLVGSQSISLCLAEYIREVMILRSTGSAEAKAARAEGSGARLSRKQREPSSVQVRMNVAASRRAT
jgi:hypothetical protein